MSREMPGACATSIAALSSAASLPRCDTSNTVAGYMKAEGGKVPHARVVSRSVRSPFFTGPLRSPARIQNTFANESFIDELAAAANADPVNFRLRMIEASTQDDGGFKRARSIAVIKAAAEKHKEMDLSKGVGIYGGSAGGRTLKRTRVACLGGRCIVASGVWAPGV